MIAYETNNTTSFNLKENFTGNLVKGYRKYQFFAWHKSTVLVNICIDSIMVLKIIIKLNNNKTILRGVFPIMRCLILCIFCILGGCSNNDGKIESTDFELTVEFIKEIVETSYTLVNINLVHEDEDLGQAYRFDKIFLSRLDYNNTKEVISIAYSLSHPKSVFPNDWDHIEKLPVVLLYIDTDNDIATGYSVEGIGADRVLIDQNLYSSLKSDYAIWDSTIGGWLYLDREYGISGITGSLIPGINDNQTVSVYIQQYRSQFTLLNTYGAKSVFVVKSFENDEPLDSSAITLGASSIFDFNTP